jgi:hypothetical protein
MRFFLLLSWAGILLTLLPRLAAQPPAGKLNEPPLTAKERTHWAFQQPIRSAPPKVQHIQRVATPVDAFILARLEKAGLTLAPPADRATLIRRVTFDLIGLPPTPAEVEAFLSDSRPDAYARVVERLLASPHYGERWAQHWLDVVRYAESNGYEADTERPHAWRYRDYVIRSFNEDKPYDRFLTEQLAGDLLAQGKEARASAELLIASGFNRCGPVHLVGGNTDPEVNRQEVLTEMTTGVGSAFLGLTVGCARCHDHKFDPFSQGDYYRLQAFFAAAQTADVDIATAEERAAVTKQVKALNDQLAPLRSQVASIDAPYRARLTESKRKSLEKVYRDALDIDPKKRTPQQKKLAADAQTLIKVSWDEIIGAMTPSEREKRAALRQKIHALEAQLPPPAAKAWTIRNDTKVPATYLLKRGDPKRKVAPVQSAFPRVLVAPEKMGNPKEASTIPDRLALAKWLTQSDHPLTARVMVNRIWQHHFGRGIVATPNDFGFRGEQPTHPELLDWLACEFVSPSSSAGGEDKVRGWSIKHIHRLIVLSNTYQQSSQVTNVQGRKVDPDNRLLWRWQRRRLEGEALRDQVLAVAGTLNRKVGGPMIRVPLEPEVYQLIFTEGEPDGLWHAHPDRREYTRRSIYLFVKRNVRLPLFEAFDQPDTLTSCPVRSVSTFAPQALILLNGPFVQEQSKALAVRLLREAGSDCEAQVRRAYQLALARPPRASELALAREFLASQTTLLRDRLRARQRVELVAEAPDTTEPAAAAALADFCLALLNSNEFVYVK